MVLSIFFGILQGFEVESAEAAVFASIVKLTGEAEWTNQAGKKRKVKEGFTLEEGGTLKAPKDSKVKILMQDKSSLLLQPDTVMTFDQAGKSGVPAQVSLVDGQVRSKILQNVLENKDTNRVRFLLKTNSAVMGVRGTDFQAMYNAQNNVSAVVTFEGAVAITKSEGGAISPNVMTMLASPTATLVTEGRFSSVSPNQSAAMIPTKLSPAQFESLKAAPDVISGNLRTAVTTSQTQRISSPIPPGVDPKTFASSGSVEKNLQAALGGQAAAETLSTAAKIQSATPTSAPAFTPPPEGMIDRTTGALSPPAGGFVDLKSGIYVPPPPGSAFDAKAGVYVPPPQLGSFDVKTGSYAPPPGVALDPVKGFVASPVVAPTNQTPTTTSATTPRMPASAPSTILTLVQSVPIVGTTRSEAVSSYIGNMQAAPTPPAVIFTVADGTRLITSGAAVAQPTISVPLPAIVVSPPPTVVNPVAGAQLTPLIPGLNQAGVNLPGSESIITAQADPLDVPNETNPDSNPGGDPNINNNPTNNNNGGNSNQDGQNTQNPPNATGFGGYTFHGNPSTHTFSIHFVVSGN
jgi:hypothetical protein